MSISSCFLYIYVGIIMPSVAILKNPSMKAFISGRFPESVIVVVDWNIYVPLNLILKKKAHPGRDKI